MNENTKRALIDLCRQIQLFAVAVSSVSGDNSATDLMAACARLEGALQKDETIP